VSDVIVVGLKTSVVKTPYTRSTIKECEDCGESVWVAIKQIAMPDLVVDSDTKAICMDCYKERMNDESR